MREFDYNGLLLAEYQGKLFEESIKLNCSTGIFMRRFQHSELVKQLDENETAFVSLIVREGINSIIEQYGDSNYGKIKYSGSSMFWIGYMYRYISYTRGKTTDFVMKTFNYRQMNEVFFTYHTQSPEWCIQNLLEINNLSENYFDNNWRFKQLLIKARSKSI